MTTTNATDTGGDANGAIDGGETDDLLAYETETGIVVCDPDDPSAWIESDVYVDTAQRR